MNRAMKPPGGDCHDLFGASFNGSPCHNRVLKPPGGGSHDIFGSPEPPASHALRKTRTYEQQASIGTVMNGTKSPADSTPSSTTSSIGNLSHSDNSNEIAHNGDAVDAPETPETLETPETMSPDLEDPVEPVLNHSVSSIQESFSECKIESSETTQTKKYVRSDSHSRIFGDESEETKSTSPPTPVDHANGTAVNGFKASASDKTDGNPVTGDGYEPTQAKETRTTSSAPSADCKPRQRVPPGGFSSGLW